MDSATELGLDPGPAPAQVDRIVPAFLWFTQALAPAQGLAAATGTVAERAQGPTVFLGLALGLAPASMATAGVSGGFRSLSFRRPFDHGRRRISSSSQTLLQ